MQGYSNRVKLVGVMSLSALLACHQQAAGTDYSKIPDESYEFLTVTRGPCVPKIGVGIEAEYETECKRMTEPRHYRGTWYVDFETSFFTPVGRQDCTKTEAVG